MEKKCLNVTHIFWPFVRSVVNTPYNVVSKTELYKVLSTFAYAEEKNYKIHMDSLYEVYKYDYDILSNCNADIKGDFMVFDSFQNLFLGVNKLYNYQTNNSEHKQLINKCLNIMNEIIQEKEQLELSNILDNLNI